jgi:ribosomal protein S18 acetylase RimI-like enzyme
LTLLRRSGTFNTEKFPFRAADTLLTVGTRMSVNYFKRFRMEIDLRGRSFAQFPLPLGYRLMAWDPDQIAEHAEAKYNSFRQEIDADVFACLGDFDGCYKLMTEISDREDFLPAATWLVAYLGNSSKPIEYCGTIQGIRASHRLGGIQNIGITPRHRRRGVGSALIAAALTGFQQAGLPRVYLEVTCQNEPAVRLYKQLGFQRTKTLYKAVEFAYS